MKIRTIAILITCHNRYDTTLKCIEALFTVVLPHQVTFKIYLVDDGSIDGTSEALQSKFPEIEIIRGNGNLYWNGGMRLAFARALKQQHDFYLWLNDDTLLRSQALQALINTYVEVVAQSKREAIIVGSTQDPNSGLTTYGGVVRTSAIRRLKFTLLNPTDKAIECETVNGNCVLIPASIALDIGNLDSAFTHAMGDFDYGLRARKAGYTIWIMSGYVGTCRHNAVDGTFQDKKLSYAKRINHMMSVKGLPPKEWITFARRYAGPFWVVYAVFPYIFQIYRMFIRK